MKNLVLGASLDANRYSHIAVIRLLQAQLEVIAFGKQAGEIAGLPILTEWQDWKEVDTVTVYVNPTILNAYVERIIALHPRRVILNPGTEDIAIQQRFEAAGIQVEQACTLVLLASGQYI